MLTSHDYCSSLEKGQDEANNEFQDFASSINSAEKHRLDEQEKVEATEEEVKFGGNSDRHMRQKSNSLTG